MTKQSPSLRAVSLDDKYHLDATDAYLTGIEALVRLPILQHQRDLQQGLNTAGFVSGYRGSPLAGLDQALWRAMPWLERHNVRFSPGLNEELAATAVAGSQQIELHAKPKFDGVFGLWYGKGPGVDRSVDAFRHANAFGTSRYGGVLAVAGDDHACKSSTLPHQSEYIFIGTSMPVLNPANVQEVLDFGILGWALSRYCGCWVGLKAITETADAAMVARIDPNRIRAELPEDFDLPAGGLHARWPDKALEQEVRLSTHKLGAARAFARANGLDRTVMDSSRPRFGIITTGKAYLDVLQALEDLGINAAMAANMGLRILKVGMSWPLEPVTAHEFAKDLEDILVVEEKRPIIEDQLTSQLYNNPVAGRPRVVGEFDEEGRELVPSRGELTPALVARAIAQASGPPFTTPRPCRPGSSSWMPRNGPWPDPALPLSVHPTSAPAARTTVPPECRRAAMPLAASAATTWRLGCRTGRRTPTPKWAARALLGWAKRHSATPRTCSRIWVTAPISTPARSPSAPPWRRE